METIQKIVDFMQKMEERNDQSVTLFLESDGSGMFGDFWNHSKIVSFENLDELNKILNK